jgi:Ca-activated chloride channel family protein
MSPWVCRTPSGFTNRPDELARAISNAPTTGKTALYDAVAKAQERLQTGARDKKVLIVISDGGDNASSHTLAGVLKVAEQSRSLMYTIGIFDDADAEKNLDVLRRLAGVTGGEAFFPSAYDEVVAICERIARDIRVVARAAGKSKLVVRTRSGYIARDDTTRPVRVQAAK